MNYITKSNDELLKLYELPLEELIEKAAGITKNNFKNEIEFCSIISAKTGKCKENCKYCSQSIKSKAKIAVHDLLSVSDVIIAAKRAKENGATHFCIVTSGRKQEGKDFEKILEMIKGVAKIEGLHTCCSLGLLSEEQIIKIKEAGAERYNHNINTAPSNHEKICTSHTFEDRLRTVKMIQKHGIEACTGVIIGMGESRKQRIEMAIELAKLSPTSVPINILNPIEGTPFEDKKDEISEEEILKTICIFRLLLPKSLLRYAGGRNRLCHKSQELGLHAGINALLTGDYLTTTGATPLEDKEMVKNEKLTIKTK